MPTSAPLASTRSRDVRCSPAGRCRRGSGGGPPAPPRNPPEGPG